MHTHTLTDTVIDAINLQSQPKTTVTVQKKQSQASFSRRLLTRGVATFLKKWRSGKTYLLLEAFGHVPSTVHNLLGQLGQQCHVEPK